MSMKQLKLYLFEFLLFLFVSTGPDGYAQLMKFITRETSGQVHLIDFTTPVPTVTIPAAGYGTTASIDYEDVNVMTDVNTNMLFTTCVYGNDLIEVRDSNWAIMPNGSGLFGNNSCQESALVKIPCTADKYYFVHSSIAPATLYYSVVDMSLNGGLGDVVQKNTFVQLNIGEGKTISHQLPTGCRWLIVPGFINDSTYEVIRFLINDIGIGSPNVIATVSLSPTLGGMPFELELSPNNTKLSMSTHRNVPADPDIIIWDFDLLSGSVSNRVDYNVSTDMIHGTEWSPDNTKVYFVGNTTNDNSDFGRINLTTGTIDIIDPVMGRYIGTIEKAGNGKIYVCPNYNHNYLAEVANPNSNIVAAIGYLHNAIFISGNGLRAALPSAIDGEPPGTTTTPQFIWFEGHATANCNEFVFRDSSCLGTWWEWDFGDGTFSNSEFPTHQYQTSDTFDVTLRMVACGDTLILAKPDYIISNLVQTQADFQVATQFCAGSQVSFINSSVNALGYVWDFGDGTTGTSTNPQHIYAVAGNYTIMLTASGITGCEDTVTQTITIFQNPVSNFIPLIDTCNLIVAFQNTSQSATGYSWSFGDQGSSNQQDPVHQYAIDGNYAVDLICQSAGGCADTSSVNINLPPLPLAGFTFQIDTCDSVAHFYNQSLNAAFLSWTFSDGGSDTAASPVHIFHSTGSQTAMIIAMSQYGCADTLTRVLNIFQNPISNFLITIDTCNLSVSFQNNSQYADGYTWNFGDQFTSSQFNPVHQYATDGSYQTTLFTSNSGLCFDTSVYNINLLPLPLANFTFQNPNCDSLFYFTDESINSGTVTWSMSDGSTYSINNPTHAFAGFGQYQVTLTAASLTTSCTSELTQTVNIIPNPTAAFNLLLDTCSMVISVLNTSLNASQYFWEFSDGTVDTASSTSHQFENAGIALIQLHAFNINNCGDSVTSLVNIPPLPVSEFVWTNNVCDSVVNFFQQSAAAVNYTWQFGDGQTSSDPNPVHNYSMAGTMPVLLISESQYGCVDTAEKDLSIVINTPADFIVYIDSCNGNAIFLNLSPLAVSYDWNFDDMASSTSPNATYSFPSNNVYTITLSVNKGTGCQEFKQEQINYYISDGEHVYLPNSFTPNGDGTNDVFRIENRVPCDDYSIDIFNRWGEIVFHADNALTDFWDGTYKSKESQDGMYVYLLRGSHSRITGHVALLK